MSGFLIDTNVASELFRLTPDNPVKRWMDLVEETLISISVLTIGELRKGATGARDPLRRAALQAWLQTDLRPRFTGRIPAVDDQIAERWGVLAGEAKLQGQTIHPIDGLLAASALHHGLTLVTRNVRDMRLVAGLPVLNPWDRT
jgi:predicted nucleic acid-binding protein